MRFMLWLFFGMQIFSAILHLLSLAIQTYPRTITYKPWEDVVSVVLALLLAVCIFGAIVIGNP
jgi:hypothetical protein